MMAPHAHVVDPLHSLHLSTYTGDNSFPFLSPVFGDLDHLEINFAGCSFVTDCSRSLIRMRACLSIIFDLFFSLIQKEGTRGMERVTFYISQACRDRSYPGGRANSETPFTDIYLPALK
jgi:hypothetical protein